MPNQILEFSIASDYDELETVAGHVQEVIGKLRLSDEDETDLMISIMEAVNNAIQHGNQADANKKVHIRMEAGPGGFDIWIQDEGQGFDVSGVPDPRAAHRLMKASGRGILMMRAFMDEVVFEPGERGGTSVRMSKRFNS